MYENGSREGSSVRRVPDRVRVSAVVSSRYHDHRRPATWDGRREGIDVVRTEGGEELKLWSDGGQSPPKRGWEIMLTGGDAQRGFHWTLYGVPAGSDL